MGSLRWGPFERRSMLKQHHWGDFFVFGRPQHYHMHLLFCGNTAFTRVIKLFRRDHPGRFVAHTLKGQSQMAGFWRYIISQPFVWYQSFGTFWLTAFFQNLSNVRTLAKSPRKAFHVRPQWAHELAGHWLCLGVVRKVSIIVILWSPTHFLHLTITMFTISRAVGSPHNRSTRLVDIKILSHWTNMGKSITYEKGVSNWRKYDFARKTLAHIYI